MSNLINKAKVALTGEPTTHTTHNTTTTGGVTGTHHNHHVGRDAAVGAGGVGIAEHEHHKHQREAAAGYGSGVAPTAGATTGATTGTATGLGPHSSSLLNKLDPRVDSTTGALKTSSGAVGTGTTTTGAAGTHAHSTVGGNTVGGNTYGSGTAEGVSGPHSSRVANALDPRVDSDRDGSARVGATHTTPGSGATHNTVGGNTYGSGTAEGVSGPHSSRIANALDPRVDSDRDGSTRIGATHATPGSGVTQNTAGPHNSDTLNKLDPRVDSDPNRTTNRTYVDKSHGDHLDAARVPPSVLREHLGDPEITHDHPEHNHQGRHGSVISKDAYNGI